MSKVELDNDDDAYDSFNDDVTYDSGLEVSKSLVSNIIFY